MLRSAGIFLVAAFSLPGWACSNEAESGSSTGVPAVRQVRELPRQEPVAAKDFPALAAADRAAVGMHRQASDLLRQGKTEQAVVVFERCVEADPGQCMCRRDLGRLLFERGERVAAAAVYRRYLEYCAGAPDEGVARQRIKALEK